MNGDYYPLDFFHDNFFFGSDATFVDNLFYISGIIPVYIVLWVSVIKFIISLYRMRLRMTLSYIIPIIIAAVFNHLQAEHLWWILE